MPRSINNGPDAKISSDQARLLFGSFDAFEAVQDCLSTRFFFRVSHYNKETELILFFARLALRAQKKTRDLIKVGGELKFNFDIILMLYSYVAIFRQEKKMLPKIDKNIARFVINVKRTVANC